MMFTILAGRPADIHPGPRLPHAVRRFRRVGPLLLCCGLPFFFVGGPGFYSARSFVHGWDLGHILYFCLFTLWLSTLKPRHCHGMNRIWRGVVLFLVPSVVAGLIEGLQFAVRGRVPSLRDFLYSILGVALALVFQKFAQRQILRIVSRGLMLLLLAVALQPFALALRDEIRARQQFPVLAEFEDQGELSRWYHANQLRLEDRIVRSGKHSARIQLSTAKISGVILLHLPHDWSGYTRLCFSVYNPQSSALEINFRLDDQQHRRRHGSFHDRYNTRFSLRPGWNDLVVSLDAAARAPRGRLMDMAHIAGFALFVVEHPKAIALYLDRVRLEK